MASGGPNGPESGSSTMPRVTEEADTEEVIQLESSHVHTDRSESTVPVVPPERAEMQAYSGNRSNSSFDDSSQRWWRQESWQHSAWQSGWSSHDTWHSPHREWDSHRSSLNHWMGSEETERGVKWKDTEPPPAYSGENPTETYQKWRRLYRMWMSTTDTPAKKQARRTLSVLSGAALAAVLTIEDKVLMSDSGAEKILQVLDALYEPFSETKTPKKFLRAVFEGARERSETMTAYTSRKTTEMIELSREGCELPEMARGLILLKHARLQERDHEDMRTWLCGNYHYDAVLKALHKLESNGRNKEGAHVFLEVAEDDARTSSHDEVLALLEDTEEIEEEDATILANYTQVRQQLSEKKLSRGYFQPSQKPAMKFANRGEAMDNIKRRTRCARCGRKGHWARECTFPPDERGGRRAEGGVSKTLFTIEEQTKPSEWQGYFVGAAWMAPDLDNPNSKASSPMNSELEMKASSPMFAEHEMKASSSEGGLTLKHDQAAVLMSSLVDQFVGLTVPSPTLSIPDTGAQCCVIGSITAERLRSEWEKRGLPLYDVEPPSRASGIGGQANTVGGIMFAAGLGQVNGLIVATVVYGDFPLLLAIGLLDSLGAILNLPVNCVEWKKHGTKSVLERLPSGHPALRIDEFAPGGWTPPPTHLGRIVPKEQTSTAVAVTEAGKVLFGTCQEVPSENSSWWLW